jgi:hypothetical protein
MFSSSCRLLACLTVYCALTGFAQPPTTRLNPLIAKVVDEVSEERITATMKKLESFGTRYVLSGKDNPTHGIGGAQHWIYDQFKSYSPRLEVSYDTFTLKKSQRIPQDTELANVVAVLPGTINKDRYVIVGGHYDSIASRRSPGGAAAQPNDEGPRSAAETDPLAPGVADDASGTAAVLELARVMSQYEFDKSIVFIAFTSEEIGLNGSSHYARKAKEANMQIEAMLNNDIIGSDVSGDGRSANGHVRLFSEGPEDSPSRALARYAKEIGERYMPSMMVDLVFRRDRFGRGGDHTSFVREGYAGVRFTTPSENYANQHSATDTFANASPSYTTRVAKINGAVLASLALAPKPPVVSRLRPAGVGAPGTGTAASTPASTAAQGDGQAAAGRQGRQGGAGGFGGAGGRGMQMLGRGKGYDAALRWLAPNPEPDLAGYAVVVRATTSALWEREIYVGNVTEFTMPGLSIDDVVIGVKAIDKDGNASLVVAYDQAPLNPQQQQQQQPQRPTAASGENRQN